MSIKIDSNNLSSLRSYFRSKLEGEYPENEIDSFFFLGLEKYLSISKLKFMTEPDRRVSESDILRMRSLAKQLREHRPIQYIFGEVEFQELHLKVNENVLIPRPETEEIIEDIKQRVMETKSILDLCTGSGCMALSLKKHYSKAKVYALEWSDEALVTAKENAQVNELDVQFIHDDVLSPQNELPKVDLIVSNPPYVRVSEKKEMRTNVLDHEPHMALFVDDEDPLIFYRAILDLSVDKLMMGGWIFMEINEKFGKELISMIKEYPHYTEWGIGVDLNGKDRWVFAKK